MLIHILYHAVDGYAAEIVQTAMQRSFTSAQIRCGSYQDLQSQPKAAVLINPQDSDRFLLERLLADGGKAVALGRIGPGIADKIQVVLDTGRTLEERLGVAVPDSNTMFDVSPASIRYTKNHCLGKAAIIDPRHLCRYDFTDEWNNLCYGRIPITDPYWGISCVAECPEEGELAWLEDETGARLTAYAAVTDRPNGSALWINRTVGPVDSLEWRLVEKFLSDYRPEDLPCFPSINEIPLGFEGAVTMRLDCDQAVASARPLFDLYRSMGLPFSLALLTGLAFDDNDRAFINEVLDLGGSIASHSVNHFPNWGGDYETAFAEGQNSKTCLESSFPNSASLKYAVSPFHQNPVYAVKALADSGYDGFVSGIIHNDPEFLLGRAGRVPFVKKIISHSQPCMLHGDCYHRYGRSVDIYIRSFENHLNAGAIFGFLDHPFSVDYQYGWRSESERTAAHEEFLKHILAIDGMWWCSTKECLDFLVKRDSTVLTLDDAGKVVIKSLKDSSPMRLAATWKGRTVAQR